MRQCNREARRIYSKPLYKLFLFAYLSLSAHGQLAMADDSALPTFDQLISSGIMKFRANDYTQAEIDFLKAIEVSKTRADAVECEAAALQNLNVLYLREGKSEEAKQCMHKRRELLNLLNSKPKSPASDSVSLETKSEVADSHALSSPSEKTIAKASENLPKFSLPSTSSRFPKRTSPSWDASASSKSTPPSPLQNGSAKNQTISRTPPSKQLPQLPEIDPKYGTLDRYKALNNMGSDALKAKKFELAAV